MAQEEIFNIVLISTLVMIGLAIAIIILFNLSQKRILEEQRIQHENEMTFQQELLYSNIETQEKERTRIARELHDDIGSKLNVINLNMRLLHRMHEKGDNTEEIEDHINTAIKSSIERTREISHELMPPILIKFGIHSALNSLATSINRTGEISVEIDIDEDWGTLDKMKELHIYRIIQELITNTIKHAKASKINIQSSINLNKIILRYADDGIGIKDEKKYMSGLGMHNIQARIKLLNAKSKLNTNTARGMHFEISIPIEYTDKRKNITL